MGRCPARRGSQSNAKTRSVLVEHEGQYPRNGVRFTGARSPCDDRCPPGRRQGSSNPLSVGTGVGEMPVKPLRQSPGVEIRVRTGPVVEELTDSLFLLEVATEVEQWTLGRVCEMERPQRSRCRTRQQRTRLERSDDVGRVRPRQRVRIDPRLLVVDGDLGEPVDLHTDRPQPDRAHCQRGRDQHRRLDVGLGQCSKSLSHMDIGGAEHACLIEGHQWRSGVQHDPCVDIGGHTVTVLPAMRSDTAAMRVADGLHSNTPQPDGVCGPIIARTKWY